MQLQQPMTTTSRELLARIGRNVRKHRLAAGLTLKTAAERAEIHWEQWEKLEAGTLNLSVAALVEVAFVLAVEPAMLFDDEDD